MYVSGHVCFVCGLARLSEGRGGDSETCVREPSQRGAREFHEMEGREACLIPAESLACVFDWYGSRKGGSGATVGKIQFENGKRRSSSLVETRTDYTRVLRNTSLKERSLSWFGH